MAPASSVLPNISPETTVHRLRGERVRGGQAGEANDLAHALESDFVVFVSGSLEGEPRWVERAVEPLRDDPKRSVAIAKDDRGALLAVRTSVLRKLSFSEDFASGAYLVDFARQAIQAGTLAAPLANLGIRFVATDPRFAEEAHAVELLSAAQESFASSQLEPGLESLQAALVAHPRYGAAFRTVSHFFEAAALPGELRGALEALVKLDPRDAVAHAQLGDLFEKLGSRERALAHLRVAHELAPEQPKLANLYADALRAAGRAREAAEVYLESLHAAPDGLRPRSEWRRRWPSSARHRTPSSFSSRSRSPRFARKCRSQCTERAPPVLGAGGWTTLAGPWPAKRRNGFAPPGAPRRPPSTASAQSSRTSAT